MKIERTLEAYGDIVVKVVTDEDVEDMEWAVVLEDHDDEYLVVKTKDKEVYRYGCFENLKHSKCLVKEPELYGKLDSTAANDIHRLVIYNLRSWHFNSPRKCLSKEEAQIDFDYFINRLNGIHEQTKCIYDCNCYKMDVVEFLRENDIETMENVRKLNFAKWDSKVDGVDGIAGKEDISDWDQIYFETIGDVYVVQKEDLEVVENYDTDEWGFGGYYLNIEPDKRLNANKSLFANVSDKPWQDWMNDTSVRLTDSVIALFDRTFIDGKSGEALYLVIRKEGNENPSATYLDAETIMSLVGKE